MVVLIPVGHLLPTPNGEAMKTPDGDKRTQDWPALVEKARTQVIGTMETRLGIKGLREKIVWEEVNTPLTCKSRTWRIAPHRTASHQARDQLIPT